MNNASKDKRSKLPVRLMVALMIIIVIFAMAWVGITMSAPTTIIDNSTQSKPATPQHQNK